MKKETVYFAILVPQDADTSVPSSEPNVEIAVEIKTAVKSETSLAFDLSQAGDLVWQAFTILAPHADTVAMGLITNYLYDKFKKHGRKDKEFEMEVRFSNGKRVLFNKSNPETLKIIEKELRNN